MKKIFAIVLILVFLVGLFVNDFLNKSQKNDIENLGIETQSSIRKTYEASINTYKLITKNEHYYVTSNKKLMKFLTEFKTANEERKSILRGEIYRLLSTHYEYLKNMNFRQFHFHTEKGKTLIRFHLPYLTGDPLIDLRETIRVANIDKKEIMGFEGGRIFPGFRYVYPIFNKNEHLGSVEYSISFEAIEKIMKQIYPDMIFHIHLDKSVSYDKVFTWHRGYFENSAFGNGHYIENKLISTISGKIVDNPLINTLNSLVKNSPDFDMKFNSHKDFSVALNLGKDSYLISFININSTTNKHAAYIVTYQKNSLVAEIINKYLIFSFLLYVSLGLITILGYIIIFQIDKIISQNKKLEMTNIKQVETIIEQNEELENIFETTNDIILIIDYKAKIQFFNRAFIKITGYSENEVKTTKWFDSFTLTERKEFISYFRKIKDEKYFDNIEASLVSKSGKIIILNISMVLMSDEKRVLIFAKDITDIMKKDRQIKDYIKLIDSNIITATTDLKGLVTDVSAAFCKNSGYKKEELIGKSLGILRDPATPSELYKDLWRTITNDRVWAGELKNIKKDGSAYWVSLTINPIFNEKNEKIGYTAIKQDITNKKLLEEISTTDGLTNVYNRRYFNEIFPKILNSAKRNKNDIYFMMLDIDFFKQYNDTYGHQMGDEVLIKVASMLKNLIKRADDYVFRLGGEEFGIIYSSEDKEHAITFAKKIQTAVYDMKIEHKGSSIKEYVTVSAGLINIFDEDEKDQAKIYKRSDDLLYKAKEEGRDRVCYNFEAK